MSDAGRKSTIAKNVPKWEAELWSYLSRGDGVCCPLYERCRFRKGGGWCPDDHSQCLNDLIGEQVVDFKDRVSSLRPEGDESCPMVRLMERLVGDYLEKGKALSPPVSTELIQIFDPKHDVEVRPLSLKVYHGAVWRYRDAWVIQVKESDSPSTQRFTIFHEAFHILAHTKTSPVFRKRGSELGSFNEGLADYFAFCMLMPRRWVEERWAQVKDIAGMAEIFAVPESAMCLRLRQLGLV